MKWFLLLSVFIVLFAFLYQKQDLFFFTKCGLQVEKELILRSTRIVTPNKLIDGAIHVKDGMIKDILEASDMSSLSEVKIIEYGDLVISPGLIDSHVHFFEPGFDEREGIKKGTRAAAAGGITTVVDYPMSCLPTTTTCQKLKSKVFRFRQEAFVNIAPIGGLVPENAANSETLKCMVDIGIFGFHSILSKDGSNLALVNFTHIESALPILKSLGIPYTIQSQSGASPWDLESEHQVIRQLISLLKIHQGVPASPGFRIHFTNLASDLSIELVKEAKEMGLPVSCELPGYSLYFSSRGDENPYLKAYPPIRSEADRLKLLQKVRDGDVDILVSDHSPTMPQDKLLSYTESVPGISGHSYLFTARKSLCFEGIQYLLPAVWSSLKSYEIDFVQLSHLLSTNPAELFKIEGKTGAIKKGLAADLIVWDPNTPADTTEKHSYSELPLMSPFINTWLKGSVEETWLKGNLIFSKKKDFAWWSCPTIYGLGEWAKIVVGWFYEVSFAPKQ